MNLVTGATGIVGSHVVLALLRSNRPVVACRQKNSDLSKVETLFSYYTSAHKALFEKIRWIEVDICDIFSVEEAMEGIETVYHCAGFVSFDKADRKKLAEINEKGTRNVVDACLAKRIKALCHVSSIAAVNNLDYTWPLNEEVFWKKSGKESDYAISKYNGEREIWRGMEEGLDAVIVNPGIILSPGFWGQSSSKLFKLCYKGSRFYTSGSTGYVTALDVARAMIELVDQQRFGQRFILIQDNYSYFEIFSRIQRNLGKQPPSIRVRKGLFNLVRILSGIPAIFTGRSPALSKAIMHAAYQDQNYTGERAKSALSFHFTPVYDTIDAICKRFLEDHK